MNKLKIEYDLYVVGVCVMVNCRHEQSKVFSPVVVCDCPPFHSQYSVQDNNHDLHDVRQCSIPLPPFTRLVVPSDVMFGCHADRIGTFMQHFEYWFLFIHSWSETYSTTRIGSQLQKSFHILGHPGGGESGATLYSGEVMWVPTYPSALRSIILGTPFILPCLWHYLDGYVFRSQTSSPRSADLPKMALVPLIKVMANLKLLHFFLGGGGDPVTLVYPALARRVPAHRERRRTSPTLLPISKKDNILMTCSPDSQVKLDKLQL